MSGDTYLAHESVPGTPTAYSYHALTIEYMDRSDRYRYRCRELSNLVVYGPSMLSSAIRTLVCSPLPILRRIRLSTLALTYWTAQA